MNGRRGFLKAGALLAAAPLMPMMAIGEPGMPMMAMGESGMPVMAIGEPGPLSMTGTDPVNDLYIIGPRDGYSPQIGTLVSMMNYLRDAVVRSVKGLTVEQLDFLLDDKANTIGALLFHLCATDAFYHEHTFKGLEWGKWDESVTKKFGVAMELGDKGRSEIKGHNLDFYLDLLKETRESTFAEFRKRDDKWLATYDKAWECNTYWKWFHVCEHESHHQGQIAFLKSRIPGVKAPAEGS